MNKYKKSILNSIIVIYIILTFIELIKYLFMDSTFFGLIYLLVNVLIIFLLVPIGYNYNRYFSISRISKFILVIIFGIFNSYILSTIVLNNMAYVDSSKIYIDSIFIIKNILKGIIYIFLAAFTILEYKSKKILTKNTNKNKKKR